VSNQVEIREIIGGPDEDRRLVLEGYASVFGTFYPIGRGVEEQVVPGAFKRTLKESPRVALRVEHDHLPLAHTKTGSLKLREDAKGLRVTANLNPRDPDAQGLLAKSENSPIEMSFSFRCNREERSEDMKQRWVKEALIDKCDVSACCFGANPDTSMTMGQRGDSSLSERRAFVEQLSGWGGHRGVTLGDSSGSATRGRSQISVPRTPWQPSRAALTLAKAKRARYATAPSVSHGVIRAARGQQAADQLASEYATGEMRASSKYTAADVAKLGREGLAHKRLDGKGYNFPAADHEDVKNAVRALGRTPASERPSVRRFLMQRAKALGATYLIPKTWHAGGSLAPA
jgi:HK97 family phage prohead protease